MPLTANERSGLLPSNVVDDPTSAPPPGPSRQPDRGFAGYVALAGALVLAIGVGLYLFLSGGDDDGPAAPDLSPAIGTPQPNTGPLDPERPEVGKPAPNFALPDARDPKRLLQLSAFEGKPLVLNFYYSDCKPCENEIPLFVRAHQQLGGEMNFLGVDYLEDAADAISILDAKGATWPAVLDQSGSVAEHYRVQGFPATFFIDKDGVLQAYRTGEVKDAMLDDYLAKIGLSFTP